MTFGQGRQQLGHGGSACVGNGRRVFRQYFDLDLTGLKAVTAAPRIQACMTRDGIEPSLGGRFGTVGMARPVYAQPDFLQDVVNVFAAISLAETESQ